MDYFAYGQQDFIPCLMCGIRANDVHHIEARGMGGSKTKDYIENLATLCRSCHDKAEHNNKFNQQVKEKNLLKIKCHS